MGHSKGFTRTKLWFPILVEPGLSGLRMAPKSHLLNLPYSSHSDDSRKFKPLLTDFNDSDAKLLNTRVGEAVFFHDKIIHGGALNLGKYPRISVEMTLLNRQKALS